MQDVRMLTDDEISAVRGGATAGGGGLPPPHQSWLHDLFANFSRFVGGLIS